MSKEREQARGALAKKILGRSIREMPDRGAIKLLTMFHEASMFGSVILTNDEVEQLRQLGFTVECEDEGGKK